MNLTANASANPMDISKINSVFPGNGAMTMDPDRQWLHVTNSVRFPAFTSSIHSGSVFISLFYLFVFRNADLAIG